MSPSTLSAQPVRAHLVLAKPAPDWWAKKGKWQGDGLEEWQGDGLEEMLKVLRKEQLQKKDSKEKD